MSEIDDLMSLDPLSLTKDGPEILAIIAYYRNNRAREEGGRMKKPKGEPGAKPTIDIAELMKSLNKPASPTTPTPGGLRRL